ncbi:S26 family signal peptidase [Streptosporangium sp. NPDC002524]|uniref:S26 family signal peptidase n=1 Tax=Streptosporangium sp. NPDC002524 TaxID=3154537 RepID=UPI003327AB8A
MEVALGVVTFFLGLFVVVRANFILVTIDGSSMEPHLRNGQKVLVSRIHRRWIQRGTCVLLDTSKLSARVRRATGGVRMVKRVAAIPGENVPEHLVEQIASQLCPVVPMEQFFLLGDNRNRSYDSRDMGYVPRASIVGVIVHTLMSDI